MFWEAFLLRCDLSREVRDEARLPRELVRHRWAPWWWAVLSESYDYPLRTGLGLLVGVAGLIRAIIHGIGF